MKMKTRFSPSLIVGAVLFCLFLIFTVLVRVVDLGCFPTEEASIGFSSLNVAVFEALGTNDLSFTVSEILGILVLLVPLAFAILALYEWIKRKSLFKIDRTLWILFAAYAVTVAFYVLFEIIVINHRPILVEGMLEASYPSSHTLLAVVIGGTAFLEVKSRATRAWIKIPLMVLLSFLAVSIPLLRLLSGVHWLTDIIAGALLGASILFLYQGTRSTLTKSE